MPARERLGQQHRRAHVDRHMRIELVAARTRRSSSRAKRAALLTSSRTGGSPSAAAKMRSAQAGIGEIGDDLDRALAAPHRRRDGHGRRPSSRPRASSAAITAPTRLPAPVTIAVRAARSSAASLLRARLAMTTTAPCPRAAPRSNLQGVSLAELQKLIDERRLPPVDQWNPEHCGHCEMRIARDGTWYHQGSPDQPAGDGPAVLDRPAARARRQPRARHAGREARDRGRGDRFPRDRDADRRQRAETEASPSGSTAATRSLPGPRIRSGSWKRRTAHRLASTQEGAQRPEAVSGAPASPGGS